MAKSRPPKKTNEPALEPRIEADLDPLSFLDEDPSANYELDVLSRGPETSPINPESPESDAISLNFDFPLPEDEPALPPPDEDLLSGLEQFLPTREDTAAAPEAKADSAPTDIFTMPLENPISEEEMGQKLNALPELDMRDLHLERFGSISNSEVKTTSVPVVYEIEDEPERDTSLDVRSTRFRVWNKVWNGYLGWEGLDKPARWFVVGKLMARFALLGLLPLALVVAASWPNAGYIYAHTSADYRQSALLYSRPLVPLAPADTTEGISNGTQVSSHLLTQLRERYSAYYTNIEADFVSGDPSSLQAVLSPDIYPAYASQVTSAFASKWTIDFSDGGQLGDSLTFTSATPSSGPERVSAYSRPLVVAVSDSTGLTLTSNVYTMVEVTFALTPAGWRIVSLVMDPLSSLSQ